MIVAHVPQTWPQVRTGDLTPEQAVLGRWPITRSKIDQYGDVIAGVYENNVVAVYDITGHTVDDENKVTFTGEPSLTWAHLIGQPTPAKPWGQQGDAWPVRVIDTASVADGDVRVDLTDTGRRAVIDGFTLIVDHQGNATVLTPVDRCVTVQPLNLTS